MVDYWLDLTQTVNRQRSKFVSLAENIKKIRKKKGWSQKELGEMIGSHLSHINRIETGKQNPSLEVLIKLADALEVSIDGLVRGSEEDFKEIRLEDKNMAERIKLLNTMDPEDRKAVIRVIDAMLTKKKILRIVAGEHDTEGIQQQLGL
jgi:transcriptional regulator with XRE-family HTH domain